MEHGCNMDLTFKLQHGGMSEVTGTAPLRSVSHHLIYLIQFIKLCIIIRAYEKKNAAHSDKCWPRNKTWLQSWGSSKMHLAAFWWHSLVQG